jgi:tetratricopeptide (TPR) repeat protein
MITLASLGIQTDEARFREQAHICGNVEALADAWLAKSRPTGIWEDYPWLAARALWPRWAPDLFSIEVFVEQHVPFEAFGKTYPENPVEAQRHWQMARAVIDLVAPSAGPVRPDLLEELSAHAGLDISNWLLDLPFDLAAQGMVDEAVEMCARLAQVDEAENFLGDRAAILTEAGRGEEAIRQVDTNLAQFPEDVWVRIKAGDVYRKLGDTVTAEAVYRHALAMTNDFGRSYDREGAVERLVNLLHETGRGAEVDALVDAVEAREAEYEKARYGGGQSSSAPHVAADCAAGGTQVGPQRTLPVR